MISAAVRCRLRTRRANESTGLGAERGDRRQRGDRQNTTPHRALPGVRAGPERGRQAGSQRADRGHHVLARRRSRNPRAARITAARAVEARNRRGRFAVGARQRTRDLHKRAVGSRARAVLEELPRATIDTLHGLAASILRRHALELGLSPSFAILDEEQAFSDAERSIDDVLDGALSGPLSSAASRLLDACFRLDRARNEITVLLGRLDEEGLPAQELSTGDHVADAARQLAALRAVCQDIVVAEPCALTASARAALKALEVQDFAGLRAALSEFAEVRASKTIRNLPFWAGAGGVSGEPFGRNQARAVGVSRRARRAC